MRYVLILLLNSILSMTFGIGLADFVPNFLAAKQSVESPAAKKHGADSKNAPVEYAYSSNIKDTAVRRASSASNNCRDQNGMVSDSVFCNSKAPTYVRSTVTNSKSQSASNNSYGNSISPSSNTAPSQVAMQSQDLKNAMGKYTSSFMLSVKPEENLDIGMGLSDQGVNGLQIKMKY